MGVAVPDVGVWWHIMRDSHPSNIKYSRALITFPPSIMLALNTQNEQVRDDIEPHDSDSIKTSLHH